MAVILKTTMCGPRGSFQAGMQAEFDAKTEQDLVRGGYAEYVGAPPVERAVLTVPEHAVAPAQPSAPQRPRRGR